MELVGTLQRPDRPWVGIEASSAALSCPEEWWSGPSHFVAVLGFNTLIFPLSQL